ncbi:MAG TPA: hypothetical protein VII49_04940 [Rhizomicrobium sp.]
MQPARAFGRRAAPSAAPVAVRPLTVEPTVEGLPPAPVTMLAAVGDVAPKRAAREPSSLDQELEDWNKARKTRRRSFREPWRSVSIAAGLGFLATSWMLPESVANVAQITLGVLSAGSFYAGWRARKA